MCKPTFFTKVLCFYCIFLPYFSNEKISTPLCLVASSMKHYIVFIFGTINSFVIITFVSDFGALSIHYIPNNKDIIHQFCQVPDSALNFLYCDTISKFVDITYTTLKKGKSNFVCSQLGLERKYRYRV